jgi:hypothetical protein
VNIDEAQKRNSQLTKAGIFVCSKGTENETCNHDLDRPRLNITTTMSTFSRRASTISARSDNSIIAISNLSPAIPSPLDDTQALHAAMGWLLNYTAASLPPRSSLAYFFWSSQGMSKHDWSVDAYKTLNSLLAFTSWFFTENNYGNPQFDPAKQTDQGIPFLSHEFYTTASTAKQYTKFTIDTRMFVVYIVLQVIPLLFCWAVLIWRMVRGSPQIDTSSFPLLDFYYKAKLEDNENIDCQDLLKADNSIFLKTLKNVNVVQRRICDIPSEESSSFLKE